MKHAKMFTRINSEEEIERQAAAIRASRPSLGGQIFLTPEEAADLLGVKADRLGQWRSLITSYTVPVYFKFGHAVRYRLDDLIAFAGARRAELAELSALYAVSAEEP